MVLEVKEWYVPALASAAALIGVTVATVAFWARRWPSVPGTIDISIYDRVDVDTVDSAMKLFLSYSYTVGNRDYAGANVAPPMVAASKSASLSARLYRERMRVKVYYCPIMPRISCLERGSLGKSLAFAAVTIGLGVWIWVAAH